MSLKEVVYIGLGANLGNREECLKKAVSGLRQKIDENLQISSVYVTKAIVLDDEKVADYLNCVVGAKTTLTPRELLACLQEIERSLGRVREAEKKRWQARSIDLDILLFGEQVIDSKDLVVPHPEMLNRRFVLEPLLELNEKEEFKKALSRIGESQSVKLYCSGSSLL